MTLTVAQQNSIATTEASALAYLSLHTADPTTTGGNEVTGGSPAYARQALVWGTAAAGQISASQVSFNAPAVTATHFGFWSAVTGGTWLGGDPLTAAQTLSAQGVIQVTPKLTVTAS